MKKVSLGLVIISLILLSTSCRNTMFMPLPFPSDDRPDTGEDETDIRAENLQAAGEELADIETLFESYIDEERKADKYEEGPFTQRGSIPKGQILTYDLGSEYQGWTYSLEIIDRDFTYDYYKANEETSPEDSANYKKVFDGILRVSYFKEGDASDDGKGPLGENAKGYVENGVFTVEFKNFDANDVMSNLASLMTSDELLINGQTFGTMISTDASMANKLLYMLFGSEYSIDYSIRAAFKSSRYNSFKELNNHPGFGESHSEKCYYFTDGDVTYSYIWDYPNTGLS